MPILNNKIDGWTSSRETWQAPKILKAFRHTWASLSIYLLSNKKSLQNMSPVGGEK